jgi:hypothetical protein
VSKVFSRDVSVASFAVEFKARCRTDNPAAHAQHAGQWMEPEPVGEYMNPASAIGLSKRTPVVMQRREPPASIDTVARAIRTRLLRGDGMVWFGTETGLRWLQARLAVVGIDVFGARNDRSVVCLDAARTLAEVKVGGFPDIVRFAEVVGAQIDRLANRCARVTIIGEATTRGLSPGASALQALLKSFARSRAVFAYRELRTEMYGSEEST